MKILILGAGAIGGYYGARLIEAGADVSETYLLDEKLNWMASMARDIANGAQRLEADDVVGDLVRRAAGFGQDAPIAQAAYCHLQVYEAQRRTNKDVQPVTMLQ
jgi:2-dehydropantoate 2-reductase